MRYPISESARPAKTRADQLEDDAECIRDKIADAPAREVATLANTAIVNALLAIAARTEERGRDLADAVSDVGADIESFRDQVTADNTDIWRAVDAVATTLTELADIAYANMPWWRRHAMNRRTRRRINAINASMDGDTEPAVRPNRRTAIAVIGVAVTLLGIPAAVSALTAALIPWDAQTSVRGYFAVLGTGLFAAIATLLAGRLAGVGDRILTWIQAGDAPLLDNEDESADALAATTGERQDGAHA